MRDYLFTVLEGPDIGRTLELKVGTTILGRLDSQPEDGENVYRFTLIDKTVSRTHAEISLADPGVPILRHLSATNDTFVDGRKIEQENLQDGQIIRLGQTVIAMEVVSKRFRPAQI
jgi:pSer/pThr/pTyr-binding forkhead associated (FHA) protein